MEWTEILKRIDAGESRTTEFKREVGTDHLAVRKTLFRISRTMVVAGSAKDSWVV